jgi:branched-subunit amino acid aminotransferase/4-amino-4-deoxychorismate lyase
VEESFLTSSSRGVVPVVRVDGQLIEDGTVGDMTTNLMHLYDQSVLSLAEDII